MKNGIIIPTHPKDFHWTRDLLNSTSSEEEIILVFSSKEDQNNFNQNCNSIVVDPKPDRIESYATYKKLEALRILQKDYDYLATIDTECIFLKPTTPYLKDIWDNNCMIVNCSGYGNIIVEHVLDDLKIDKKDYPYFTNLYSWFNDIQVYPTSLIEEFLNWCPQNINWWSFDYVIFSVFMIMKYNHKFKLFKGLDPYGIVENFPLHPNLHDLVKETNWSPYFPGVEKNDNIKILFHLDRYPLPKDFKL